MPFSTLRRLPDDIPPLAGVLIKRKWLTQAARADRLVHEAKRRAQVLIREGEREAQAFRQYAVTAGYEAGFALAVGQAAESLARMRELALTLHERVAEEVQRSLETMLGDSDVLLRLAEALASRRVCAAAEALRVTIPSRAKRIAPIVRERLEAAYPVVEVTLSGSPSFVVEWGAEILEFHPGESAHELTAAALASCNSMIEAIDGDMFAAQIMADALRGLSHSGATHTAASCTGAPAETTPGRHHFDD